MTTQQILHERTTECRQYLRFIEDHAVSGAITNILNILEALPRLTAGMNEQNEWNTMKILDLDTQELILRDDLEEEDLICLLDLLRDVRDEHTGTFIDVKVGTKQPRTDRKEG